MAVIGGRYYSPEEIEEMALSPFDMPPIRQSPIQPQSSGPSVESPPPPSGLPTSATTAPLEPMDAPPSMPPNISGEPMEGREEPEPSQIHIQTLPPNRDIKDAFPSPYDEILKSVDDPAMRQLYLELLRPDREMEQRFAGMMDKFPIRKPPTKLGRISAMLSGLSTVGHPQREPFAEREIEDALRGPYNRELSDWKTQAELARDVAASERQANVSSRIAGTQLMADERGRQRLQADIASREQRDLQANRRLDLDEQTQRDLKEYRDQQLAIANKKLDEQIIYRNEEPLRRDVFFTQNGKAVIVLRNGRVRIVDESLQTPEQMAQIRAKAANSTIRYPPTLAIEDPDNPGQSMLVVRTPDGGFKKLTDRDILGLFAPVDQQGAANTETPAPAAPDQTGQPPQGGEPPPPPPGGRTIRPPPRTQTNRPEDLASRMLGRERFVTQVARQALVDNPEWNTWIKFNNAGTVFRRLTPPGMFGSQDTYRQIREYFKKFGVTETELMGTIGQSPTTQILPAGRQSPQGKVRVRRKSDGMVGSMDANDPALKSGEFEVIQ